jgi:predicted O-methyltransferase YrrM
MIQGIFDFEFILEGEENENTLIIVFEKFELCKPLIERLLATIQGPCYIIAPEGICVDDSDSIKRLFHYDAGEWTTARDFSSKNLKSAGQNLENIGAQIRSTRIDKVFFLMNHSRFFGPWEADYIRKHFGKPVVWGVDADCALQTWHHNHMHVRIENKMLNLFGPLEPDEGNFLYSMVSKLNHRKGEIVEIGTFSGKSAICMALALKNGNPAKVFTVDHQVHEMFWPNVRRFKVQDRIVAIEKASPGAVQDWLHHPANSSRRINLLFIDGGHTYEEVVNDFNAWEPHLINNGYLCFHDYDAVWGVQRAVHDLVIKSERFDSFERVNHLFICRKIGNKS